MKHNIRPLRDGEEYKITIFADSAEWDDENGADPKAVCVMCETHLTTDIYGMLENYGLDFDEFESYKEHGLEKNRFEWDNIEKENGKQYIVSYSVYVSILTEVDNIWGTQ